MPDQKQPKGRYTTHRISQRERILDVAQDLFSQKGIEQTTLAEIARAARLTRATIYEYFANKSEIAWAIFEGIIHEWRLIFERQLWSSTGSGYEKLAAFLNGFVDRVTRFPREARFQAQFDYLYAKEWPASRKLAALQRGLDGNELFLAEIIRQGLADGSLRADLDPNLARAAVLNLVAGLVDRWGLLGAKLEAEYGLAAEGILREICRIFLAGIQAQPAPVSGSTLPIIDTEKGAQSNV